jgi:imidazolonepropionase-like amidohydrolase
MLEHMNAAVLVCGAVVDGVSGELAGRTEIAVHDGIIVDIGRSVSRPDGAETIDLTDRTRSPGFIDTHVHLTMDAATLARQTLDSSAAKALHGLAIAQQYLRFGFTTLRDLGSMDPDFPTADLRNALNVGLVPGPRLIMAAHILSATAGHGDLSGFYAARWQLPVSAVADSTAQIRALVRREHAHGSDWIKTANAGGYFSVETTLPGAATPNRCDGPTVTESHIHSKRSTSRRTKQHCQASNASRVLRTRRGLVSLRER